MQMERIQKNEDRLDAVSQSLKNLEMALADFTSHKKDLMYLNKYYGSPNWYRDKEAYEQGKIPPIKAGVLSEDAVWDLNEDIKELKKEIQKM